MLRVADPCDPGYDARRNMTLQTRAALLATLALTLSACNVYRPEVRQGNYIQSNKLEQLTPGMTRAQVRFLMGPPMVADPFHPERWDFLFTVEGSETNPPRPQRHVVILFDGDLVRSVTEQRAAAPAR